MHALPPIHTKLYSFRPMFGSHKMHSVCLETILLAAMNLIFLPGITSPPLVDTQFQHDPRKLKKKKKH